MTIVDGLLALCMAQVRSDATLCTVIQNSHVPSYSETGPVEVQRTCNAHPFKLDPRSSILAAAINVQTVNVRARSSFKLNHQV